MNKRGELELRDFGVIFLIYILLMTNVAISTDISISDNLSLPSINPSIETPEQPEQQPEEQNSTIEEIVESSENITEESNQSEEEPQLNSTNEYPEQNQTTSIPEQNQTNQTTPEPINESELRVELIQGEAVIGEKVKWTKKIYTNDSNIEIKIPEEAEEIRKTLKIKEPQPESFGITASEEPEENHIEITYETPAPKIEETTKPDGKEVLIYSKTHYEEVLAFTNLSEEFEIKNPQDVKINWIEESRQIIPTKIEDTNGNGIYDYIEWTVPHLSNQTFEIIVVTRATHLNKDKEFISNIYEEIRDLDNIWSETIQENEFARVTFERPLDSTKDITIYSRTVSGNPRIEVYEKDSNEIITEFANLVDGKNKVYLTNLVNQQDTFDLKVLEGSLEFDYIIDPPTPIVEGFQATSLGTTAAATINLAAPAGITAGELLLIIVGNDDASSTQQFSNNVAGWNMIGQSGTTISDAHIAAYWRQADGTEGTVSITAQSADNIFGWYIRISGADTTTPIDNSNFASGGSVVSRIIPSITTTHNNSLAIYGLSFDGGDGDPFSVSGAGWSESDEQEAGGGIGNAGGCWGTKGQTLAGATGTATVASAVADSSAYFQIAIRTRPNLPPTTPTNLTCNGGSCNITVDKSVTLNCSGSTDADADQITYMINTTNGYIGNHTAGSTFAWNTTSLSETSSVNFTCTAYDLTGSNSANSPYSLNTSLAIDHTAPTIDFTSPTESDGAAINATSIFINLTITENNTANTTFYLYNLTSLVSTQFFPNKTSAYNFTNLPNTQYFYNVTVFDKVGYSGNSPTRNIILDTSLPLVNFVSPNTPLNNTLIGDNSFTADLNITEINFKNVTYSIYNTTGLFSQTTYTTKTSTHNFLGLPNGNYSYYATVYDLANQSNSTETRTIRVSSTNPIITFSGQTYPTNATISGTTLTAEVNVIEENEANITFYIFNETGFPERTPSTYTDARRTISWTFLPEGTYFYNVTVFNIFGKNSSTETRKITLDNQVPIVDYSQPTSPDNSYLSQNFIYINTSLTETNFANITFNLYNLTNLVSSQVFADTTRAYNFTNLPDTEYFYNITVTDQANNLGHSTTRKVTLDTTSPIVDFAAPTPNDFANLSQTWLLINTSIIETNFANITFYIYGPSGLVNQTTTSQKFLNVTNLETNFYSYNFTTYDLAGNFASSSTRTIGLDTSGPIISITSPEAKAYGNGTNIPLTYTVSDPIAQPHTCWFNINNGANTTVSCTGSSQFTVADGSHTLRFFANDTFGNPSNSQVTFLVSTTGPAISLYNPANDTFYPSATNTLFNYSATDPDGVQSCSLFGTWNGAWHLNQTDSSYALLTNTTIKTCSQTWPGLDCGASPLSAEGDNTWNTCTSQGTSADESIEQMWLSYTKTIPGTTLQAICYIDPYGTSNEVYMWYYNGTGWRTIYSGTAPSATNYNLTQSFTVDNVIGTHWVRCGIGYDNDPDVSTTYCVNQGSYFDNDDTNFTVVAAKTFANFTVNLTTEGEYKWNVECNDSLSYKSTALNNYSVGIDLTNPIVDFGIGTLSDNSRVSDNKVYINTSVTETNPKNITFFLFNSSNFLINYQTFSDGTRNITWTSLSDQTYYYNFTAYDKSGRYTSSSTRAIELDTTPPTGTSDSPGNGYFTKDKTQNLTATVSDSLELKDATLFVVNSTGHTIYSSLISLVGLTSATVGIIYEFLYDDVFTWFYRVRDSVNNEYNTTANSIEIDSTAPTITFIAPTENTNSIVLRDYITINTSIYEKNYKNITFWLYNDEGIVSPSPNTFSDSTRQINWTVLSDDKYYYNVTSYDLAGNIGYSETRTITLDTTPPVLTFSGATKSNDSVITGTSITAEVSVTEVNEQNITFALYNETGGLAKPLSVFTDGRRVVTWTLLDEGIYFYNVTLIDKVNQKGSTETRKIILDNTAPVIDFSTPTENSNTNKSQNWIFINSSLTELNFQNITFFLFNSTGLVSNQTYNDSTRTHNFTNLPNEIYFYNITVFDKANQNSSSQTRKITLDTILPIISFTLPTENNGVTRNRNWVYLNTTVTEQNFKQITFNLYSPEGLITEQTFTDETRSYNFTNLPDENYQYNVTVLDFSGNANSSETRSIGLDSSGPVVIITKPRAKTYGYNESLPLEHIVSDKVSSVEACWWNLDNTANQSIACGTTTTFNTSVAAHTLYFYANDTFGNIGQDSVSFFISITGPAIELISPINDTFYGASTWINFSFSAYDPDGVDTCSLFGNWNGAWHQNKTYSGNWQDVASENRREINVTNTGSTTLTDFPIYLNISSYHTETGDYADLLFFSGTCDSAGTALSYEIEDYTSSQANIWLKIPSFTVGTNTICMYYKNPDAESTEAPASVWSASYTSVYHLDQTSGTAIDTLGNFNAEDGIDPDSNMNTSGKIGGADYFDGTDYLGTNPEWNVDGAHTYCAWVKFTTGHNGTILEDGGTTDGTGLGVTPTGEFRYAECYNGAFNPIDSGTTYADNSWHYVCGGHTGTVQFLYIDGRLSSSATQGDGLSGTDNARIGSATGTNPVFDDSLAHNFIGTLDEIRVSSTSRSTDWINQSYQQITNYGSTVTLGQEQNFTAFQIPIQEEGSYKWNIKCNDTIGYDSFGLNNFTFIVDVTDPQIFFGSGTTANNSNVGRNWIFADVNLIENNFKNITFNLYNSTGFLRANSYADSTRQTNFTNLASGTYYYNVTVFDRANHVGYSETRKITLDLMAPNGNLNTPANNSYLNNLNQNLTATFSDTTGLLNATLYVLNATGQIIHTQVVGLGGSLSATVGIVYNFLTEGIYRWFYQIEDIVGNKMNTTINTLTIDTTQPLIEYTIGTEESGLIFERENIFVNVTSSDTYWKNITFNLYDSDSQVFSHSFSDSTRQINWTLLPDEVYFYNVTARDLAGNSNTTTTRNLTLDNLAPTIDFSSSTKPSGSFASGDSITLAVEVTEANEANITFNLYNATGFNIKTNTYTNSQREITWNLLSQGTYYYNVTVVDKVSHSVSTLTRSIILDDTNPQITYGFGTLANNTHINQNWIFVAATLVEENFQNITFTLYNSTGTVSQSTFTDTTRQINFTNLANTQYWYQITSYDKASNFGVSETRYTTLDSVNPIIQFVAPTEINNFNKTENWIFINTTISELNFQNITFNLYDGTTLINQTIYTSQTYNINFTNLPSKVYKYNVTTSDKAGNTNSTEERIIGIDYLGPTIQIINPKAKAYGTNISLPLEYSVVDNIVGVSTCWYNIDNTANKTVNCQSPTTFNTTNGQHTLHFFANDTFGNQAYKNVTFLVSTTGPAIQLLTPEDNSFYSQETKLFFNYTAIDPDKVESCSLFGSWGLGWHLNQTDFSFGLIGNDTNRTCDNTWGAACGTDACPEPSGKDVFDSCAQSCQATDERVSAMQLDTTEVVSGESLGVSCTWDAGWATDYVYIWYWNGTAWRELYSNSGNLGNAFQHSLSFTPDPVFGSQHWVRCSISYNSPVTDFCTDTEDGGYGDNDDTNFTVAPPKEEGNFTLNLSQEGTSEWNVLCNDTLGYLTSAVSNYSITFDVTDPVVDFGLNTLPDNTNISQNFIYINSSIIENNFRNMTFFLYNSTGLVTTYFQNDSTRDHTFTSLPDKRYYYNITVFDSAGRFGNSPTRIILLDTTSPTGNPTSPANNLITNNPSQNLTATLSDENGLAQAILYVFNQTGFVYSSIIPLSGELSIIIGTIYNFLSDGVYNWFYQAEDIVGNKFNTTNYTITIDTTLPQINFISPTLSNNTYITQNYIYINTSVVEINFKNITFSLFNGEGLYDSYTFTSTKRDINYTLLPDDEYFYNVTSSDLAGNKNTSETRIITLDNLPPSASYVSPTEGSAANKSQSFIFINTSIQETNFANITFRLYLASTLINTTTFQSKTGQINFTNLADGTYFYNATIADKAGQTFNLSTRKITLDTTNPILFFIAPTEDSGVSLEQEFISLNTFLSETNFKNITFYLYNQTHLLNQTTYQSQITQINFQASGTNKTYFYNATTYDTAGNFFSTPTRNITLIDTIFPTLTLTSPQNKTYTYNTSLRIDYSAYDIHLDKCWYSLNFGTNITMPNCQGVAINVADEQSHFLQVYTNDTMGYTTSRNVTFFVNSSLIKMPEIYSVQRGSIFTDGTSTQPIEEIHPTKGFILHTVRAGTSTPATLQVTSDFTDPEEIIFKNYESGSGAITEWSLVAGPNITVQRGEIPYTNENTLSLSITQVNLSNSFIIVNNRLDSSTSSQNIDGFWTGKFSDDSNVNFTRSSNLAVGTLSYQIVSWKEVSTQRGFAQISSTGTTTEKTISQINTNKTFMIFSKRSTDTLIQNAMAKGRIKNSTILNFTREGSTGTLDIEWFTVQSDLFAAQHGTHSHTISSSPQYATIPMPLINITRSFDIHSNENSGASTSFATSYLTQNIYNKTAIVLQKGVAAGTGTTSWSAIEITELDAPKIILTYPINTQNFSGLIIPSFNLTISDESQILNCSLYGNWNGDWHLNQTILTPARDVIINFSSITVEADGYYSWNVECIDAYKNIGWNSQNFTFAAFLPPTNPTVYNITQTTNDGLGDVILSWNKSNHSTTYEIYTGPTPSALVYLTETTNENYTDNTFAGNKRRFYQVIATNPTGQNASEIFSAHLYELRHINNKSRNWIAFPSNFSYLENANQTLNEIPQATSFTTFNATTQSRVTCNDFSCPQTLSCTSTNCNFQIQPGLGYEVNINTSLSQAVNWSAVGKIYDKQILNLTRPGSGSFGKNWIALHADTTLTVAQDILSSLNTKIDAVSKWNSINQASEGRIPTSFPWAPFIGSNFNLSIEEGYEVSIVTIGTTHWTQN